MRAVGLAVFGVVVMAPGRSTGCNGPDEIAVRWELPDGPGTSGVDTLGCFDWDVSLTDSGATVSPGWTRCAVRGWHQDGALRVEGPVVAIGTRSAEQVLELGLSDGPIAGMGAQIRSFGGAIRVERVVAGGPADLAGIEPGAWLVAVDDVPTEGMTTAAFVREATGLPGTVARYVVRHRDGRADVVWLERQRIPADWDEPPWARCGGIH